MTEIAAAEGIDLGQASKISRLAQLAPDLIDFPRGVLKRQGPETAPTQGERAKKIPTG